MQKITNIAVILTAIMTLIGIALPIVSSVLH